MDVIQEYNNIKLKPQGFLCNISLINDKLEFHFYNKEKNLITSYPDNQQDEPFIKPGTIIEELKINEIKITLTQAIEIAEKNNKEESKTIITLHQTTHPIWNISHITSSYNLINTKINAITGKIEEQTTESLLSNYSKK
jgi:hypothetical protein